MLQGHTMAIVPCGNPTPKKLPTGGGEWPTFRTVRAQRTVRPLYKPCLLMGPHTRGQDQKWLLDPCLLGGPYVGGMAT